MAAQEVLCCRFYAMLGRARKARILLNMLCLAVILILVIGTVRLIGGNANNVFSTVASSVQ